MWVLNPQKQDAIFGRLVLVSGRGGRGPSLSSPPGWNWFDSFVTCIGIADVAWQLLSKDPPDIAGTLLLRCFRLVRLARVVRVFRLKIMSDLRLMVRGLVAGIWTLALAFCLLFAVLYLIAGLASFTMGRDSRMAALGMEQLFYNIPVAMFTAFRCFIGDCNTMAGEPIMLVLAEEFGVVFVLGYVASYMLVAMGIFNVLSPATSRSWSFLPRVSFLACLQ